MDRRLQVLMMMVGRDFSAGSLGRQRAELVLIGFEKSPDNPRHYKERYGRYCFWHR